MAGGGVGLGCERGRGKSGYHLSLSASAPPSAQDNFANAPSNIATEQEYNDTVQGEACDLPIPVFYDSGVRNDAELDCCPDEAHGLLPFQGHMRDSPGLQLWVLHRGL